MMTVSSGWMQWMAGNQFIPLLTLPLRTVRILREQLVCCFVLHPKFIAVIHFASFVTLCSLTR